LGGGDKVGASVSEYFGRPVIFVREYQTFHETKLSRTYFTDEIEAQIYV
jgi:adenine/guanine phosphoribosyltransferase-like PRPP-binding protein